MDIEHTHTHTHHTTHTDFTTHSLTSKLCIHLHIQGDSQFSGSGAVSGVLIFSVVSSLMGLVRAAYEEKTEYFASLASNILQSVQRALDTIQRTNESVFKILVCQVYMINDHSMQRVY